MRKKKVKKIDHRKRFRMSIVTNHTKIASLITDLKKAEKILSEYSEGYSGKFLSAEEFHRDLFYSITKLENGDNSVIENLWVWFAPTCQWDDFVGDVNLGERIFQKLDKIKHTTGR